MNISELKSELIRKIINTSDIETLKKLEEILKDETLNADILNEPLTIYKKPAEVRFFNDWQQARIDLALKQVENGDYISDEAAQIEIEKWFEEQEK